MICQPLGHLLGPGSRVPGPGSRTQDPGPRTQYADLLQYVFRGRQQQVVPTSNPLQFGRSLIKKDARHIIKQNAVWSQLPQLKKRSLLFYSYSSKHFNRNERRPSVFQQSPFLKKYIFLLQYKYNTVVMLKRSEKVIFYISICAASAAICDRQ